MSIMGITTDAFGAILVLRHIDIRASQIYLNNPDIPHRKSLVIPEQVYKCQGNFRETCVRTCQMHNFERILSEIISKLKGSQGLAYDMTSARNLYRVNYCWEKYRAMVNTTTVQSLGGDADLLNTAPVEVRNLLGSVNATKWLSTERTCDKLITALSILPRYPS